MKNFYLILIIIILFFYKINIENMEIDSRTFNGLKCQFGWEQGDTGSTMKYTGSQDENEFITYAGIDVLSACECDEIFVGQTKKVNPCNPPACMKKLTGYMGNCGDKIKKETKKKVIKLNPTEFGSVNETNLVRAFVKHINNISDDLFSIKDNETSLLKYDDFLLGMADLNDLIRPENISFKDLQEKVKLFKEETSEKKN